MTGQILPVKVSFAINEIAVIFIVVLKDAALKS